jgi:hypothetical protein
MISFKSEEFFVNLWDGAWGCFWFQAEFIGKIKNSISVPSHSDAIFSLGPSLQALLDNAFSPKPAFSKQGAGTRIKF